MPLLGTLPGHESGGSFILFLRDAKQVQRAQPVPKKITPSSNIMLEIQKEQDHLAVLKSELDNSIVKQKINRTVSTASFITSGVTGIAAGALYFLGNAAMSSYQSASNPNDAQADHNMVTLYNTLFISSLSITGAGLGVGGFFLATAPSPAKLESQVQSSLEQLRKLEARKAVEEVKE